MGKTYQLHIELTRDVTLTVGKLGTFSFPKGRYIYTGSARKNIDARIKRHLRSAKKLRWHIDYFLSHPAARIMGVAILKSGECAGNKRVKGHIIAPRFGATDCREGCVSHLKCVQLE